jgi:hypothetical protein
MTTTPTFAAGVAVIKGIAGTPLTDLTGLAWDHREDGHCGAGAPRWNVSVHSTVTGNNYTAFLGCNAASHTEETSYGGHGWCRDTQPSPAAQVALLTGEDAEDLTIRGLAINFDEGNDTPNPPPTGRAQEQLAGGFVYLDNIEVDVNAIAKCWTSANDNGGSAGPCPSSSSNGLGLSVGSTSALAPVTVDPSDVELVQALGLAYPGVSLLDWALYPYVY